MKTNNKNIYACIFVMLIVHFFAAIMPLTALGKSDADAITGNDSAVTVVDGIGRTVTVLSTPRRIVSLSPAATEIIFAIGAEDSLVARTDLCNYPAESSSIPSLGGFDGKTFSLESIIAFRPDFVYATDVMHNHLIEPLERYGIPVYVSNSTTIEDVFKEITDIGNITDHTRQGESCIAKIKVQLAQAAGKVHAEKTRKVRIYWEVWNKPYMSVGKTSFIHALIEAAGAENIFADVEQSYPVVSEESIIARKPDIILYSSDSGMTAESISKRNGWNLISAVKNGRIYPIEADLLTRPGPRIGEASLSLADIIIKAENEK